MFEVLFGEDTSKKAVAKMCLIIALLAAVTFGPMAAVMGRPPIIRDSFAYNMTAQRLLKTHTFYYDLSDNVGKATPNAFTVPGYPLFLSGIYAFSHRTANTVQNALDAQQSIIIVQLFLMVCFAVVMALDGALLGNLRLGYVTGILTGLYLPFGMNAVVALSDVLALALMAVVIFFMISLYRSCSIASNSSRIVLAVLYGLFGGISLLVRPVIALWLIIPLAILLLKERADRRFALRLCVVACATIVVVLSPWVIRNAVSLHEFIPLTASSSRPLLDSVGGTTYTAGEKALMASAEAQGKDPEYVVATSRIKKLWNDDPAGYLKNKVKIAYIAVSSPVDLVNDIMVDLESSGEPSTGTWAEPGIAKVYPLGNTGLYRFLAGWTEVYHVLLLLLAVVGIILGRKRKIIWALVSIPVYYIIVHMIILFMARYFYPAQSALILLAAFGATGIYYRWSSRTEVATAGHAGKQQAKRAKKSKKR